MFRTICPDLMEVNSGFCLPVDITGDTDIMIEGESIKVQKGEKMTTEKSECDADHINTHGLVCDFGRHKGELYTRLPVGYLKWMANSNLDNNKSNIAQAELNRRGTVTPDIDISGHAIDGASLRIRKTWHMTRGENEGLHSWLTRMAIEAMDHAYTDDENPELYRYKGVKFIIDTSGVWPVLKTVMRCKKTELKEDNETKHQASR